MKIIIPMAGMGKRMRPHTLTTPKPLLKVAGKPIVHRLVEDIAEIAGEKIEEVAFIIGPGFGKKVEEELLGIAQAIGSRGALYYQDEALGTAHAVLCAANSLSGRLIVAFADTLFRTNMKLHAEVDGVIWTSEVEDPRQFGVVKEDGSGAIQTFVEKPAEFVSNKAIIGIYYFKDGEYLKTELQYLIDHKVMDKGEYQITNALQNMVDKGKRLESGSVQDWLDCGNKNATVNTNGRYLEFLVDRKEPLRSASASLENSVIIEPVFLDEGVRIINSVVGPYVSVGKNTVVENSLVSHAILGEETKVEGMNVNQAMLGNHVIAKGKATDLSLGDYSTIE